MGYAPYPSVGITNKDGDVILIYSEINLAYKMALGLLFACDGNSGKNKLFSNASGGIWHSYDKTLIPLDSYHMNSWLSPGDQGTK